MFRRIGRNGGRADTGGGRRSVRSVDGISAGAAAAAARNFRKPPPRGCRLVDGRGEPTDRIV